MGIMPGLAVIGGGNMASAIIHGGVEAGVLDPAQVFVSEPDASKHAGLAAMGVHVFASSPEAMERLPSDGQVLLAVKPQQLSVVAAELLPFLKHRQSPIVITILAGASAAKVAASLGGSVKVVRVMPNTPARLRKGISALSLGQGVSNADARFAVELFGAVGKVVRIDESLMDAFTSVAASGPAYVFFLAQTMVESAIKLGFDEQTALSIVRETVAGAGALLAATGDGPQRLVASVQSKGGTTEAAMKVLEREHVSRAIVDALTAARDRGRELAQ